MTASRIYRGALRCYPASFRRQYGDDLVAAFEDLYADRGIRVAWSRTMMDFVVTVPAYRLESIMSQHRASLTFTVTVASAGFATLAVGTSPVGLGLLAVAVLLLTTQRSALAQSRHHGGPGRRRQHLLLGAVVAIGLFASLIAAYLADIGDEHVGDGALMVYNLVGSLSAIALTVVGLRTPNHSPAATPD